MEKELSFLLLHRKRRKKNIRQWFIIMRWIHVSYPEIMMNSSVSYCERLGIKVFLPEYRIHWKILWHYHWRLLSHVEICFENAERLGVDKGRVLVYGDSAGGCLAESVTLLNRDRENYHLRGQMLVYPVCDNESEKYASVKNYKDADVEWKAKWDNVEKHDHETG